MIEVQPNPEQRRAFAAHAVLQKPKWRTVSPTSFAVPADLFTALPEELLIGAVVDGHRYVSPDEDAALGNQPFARLLDCGKCYEEVGGEVHPHPECPLGTTAGLELVGVATEAGFREAVPGEPVPEVPAEAYDADSVPLTAADTSEAAPSGAPEGVFPCGSCDRDFTTERGRDTHERMKHPEA
ncbi:hypothetical protein A6A29_16640 [Streptomyces sp. TSRI0281]|nr:hypothetical protein A6A29_16640 [Streptomyces sp. TSRI0281]